MDVNNIFYNSDYVVIEYMDLIKSPYLILLDCLRYNKKIREIIRVEDIELLDGASLYEWYINRKHRNIFMELNRYPDEITEEQMDELLEDQINITPIFYNNAVPLFLDNALKLMKIKKVAKDIIIYHPHQNLFCKQDLENRHGMKFTVMSNFDKILDKAGVNSTYFLSNVENVLKMKERGVLKFSSITIPLEYRYNKKNMTDYKVDFDSLVKENVFKLSFTRACTYDVKDDEVPE